MYIIGESCDYITALHCTLTFIFNIIFYILYFFNNEVFFIRSLVKKIKACYIIKYAFNFIKKSIIILIVKKSMFNEYKFM